MKKIKLYLPLFGATLALALTSFLASAQLRNPYFYYGPQGEKITLQVSTEQIMLKMADNAPVVQKNAFLNNRNLLVQPKAVPGYSGEVYMAKPSLIRNPGQLEGHLAQLRKDPNVAYANPFFITEDSVLNGVSDEFIVRLKSATDLPKLKQIARETNTVIQSQNPFFPEVFVMQAGKQSAGNALEMANFFHESGLFEYAEPNFVRMAPNSVPVNDPFYPEQWYVENNGPSATFPGATADADIDAKEAWELSTGEGIKVAILDVGVQLDHPDLIGNIAPGFDATDRKGLDGADGSPYLAFRDGHGTSCAGLVAGVANNGVGIAGVAYNSKIVPIRIGYAVFPGSSSFVSNAVWLFNSCVWAVTPEILGGGGADILSNSYSFGAPSSLIDEGIYFVTTQGRNGKGALFFASSGNSNSLTVSYPARNPNAIAVGASTMCDTRKFPGDCSPQPWWGSNFGTGLDIAAPGVMTITADLVGTNGYDPGDYTFFSGTSAAAPIAAATAALVLSANPDLTETEARFILESTAEKVGGYTYEPNPDQPNGTWTSRMGYGRINARLAVEKALDAVSNPNFIADFKASATALCGLGSVTEFSNTSANAVSWEWTFEGGMPATSTDSLVTVTYSTAGSFAVSLTVTDVNGNTKTLTRSNYITVTDPYATASPLPLLADFEEEDLFPDNNWWLFEREDDGISWEKVTGVSAYGIGNGAVKINNLLSGFGTQDWIILPSIDLAEVESQLVLSFDYAHAMYQNFEDVLAIQYATDCSDSYSVLEWLPTSLLQTAPGQLEPFVPTASQWKTYAFDLSEFAAALRASGVKTLSLALICRGFGGNALYLDNIRATEAPLPYPGLVANEPITFSPDMPILFENTSVFAESIAWELEGADPATSSDTTVAARYAAISSFDASITATNANGEATVTLPDYITHYAPVPLPVSYGFESDLPAGWLNISSQPAAPLFRVGPESFPAFGAFGKSDYLGVITHPFYFSIGAKDGLALPTANVAGKSSLFFSFDYAYACFTDGVDAYCDGFEVYVSNDPAASATDLSSYELVWSKSGEELGTAPPYPDLFLPTAAQWKREVIDLTRFLGKGTVRVVVLGVSNASNLFFLDNLHLDEQISPEVLYFNLVDAETETVLGPLTEVMNLYDYSARQFAIEAVVSSGSGVGRVALEMNGPMKAKRNEAAAPYTLFGDVNGDYRGVPFKTGSYTLSATPYIKGNQTGIAHSINFEVINQAPISVFEFFLVNATTDEGIEPLGDLIDIGAYGKDLTVVALTDPSTVGSVVLELKGTYNWKQTENLEFYSLFGDIENDFNGWPGGAVVGTYELIATPYTQANGKGVKGLPLSKSFEIVDTGAGGAVASVRGPQVPLVGGQKLLVYPNPAQTEIRVQLGQSEKPVTALHVYDVMGRLQMQVTDENAWQAGQLTLPIQQLPEGMYLLRVQRQDQVETVRFVKK